MGLTPPQVGSIKYNGEELVGKPTYEIARRGIGFVPEDRRVFPHLTVQENLEVAMKPSPKGTQRWTIERAYALFPQLKRLASRKAGHLSGGEQQMLAIARTLMGNPDMVLLDEPSEGLAPAVVETLTQQLSQLKEEGLTILLCEQNLDFALELGDRAYIIEKGLIRYEGPIDELRYNEELRRTYLAL